MRYKSIKLVNYVGIYNGLGLNELSIDLSKCQHKTLIIRGDNGSGKSTLFNALDLLPDSNDQFIPMMNASKEIEFYDNQTIYYIKFLHPIKQDGERDTTKAYIYKLLPGNTIDLNPNGNVSTFKDILYDEFKLDSNYIALSKLSMDDRGLADRKPADRKKFVNSIIENLDTYNSIHKVLTKRSSIFKSMINSLTAKLDNLGNLNALKQNLSSIEQRITDKSSERDNLAEAIATAKSVIALVDPTGDIQSKYGTLLTIENDHMGKINSIKMTLSKACISYGIESLKNIIDIDNSLLKKKNDISTDIQILRNSLSIDLSSREAESAALVDKSERLKSIQNTDSYTTIIRKIKLCQTAIDNAEEIFKQIGISDAIKISKDEYVSALNTLKDIKEVINVFKSEFDYNMIDHIMKHLGMYGYFIDSAENIREETKDINILTDRLAKLNGELSSAETLVTVASKLSMRPNKCKINDCDFIRDALEAESHSPMELMISLKNQIVETENTIRLKKESIEYSTKELECINYMKIIIRSMNSNKGILSKLPNGELYTDYVRFFEVFLSGESFDYIDTLYSYIKYANLFEEYKVNKDLMSILKNDLSIYESKSTIIEEINRDIDAISNKISLLEKNIYDYNNRIYEYEKELLEVNNQETGIASIIILNKQLAQEELEVKTIQDSKDSIQNNISKIQSALNTMSTLSSTMTDLNRSLKILNDDRDKLKYAINMSEEYAREKIEYSMKYNKIEKIKYYSSPTTGIQLVFMELYMSKILSLANELLQYIFAGRFVIQPFIITDNEFRIPCIGNGYMNDDIKSLSSGELAMISMIISFSLLYQSSTKYNILKLDEIDAPLDSTNRLQFLVVLDKLIEILESEQCIMISHNNEIDTNNVDVIVLRTSSTEDIRGNIIYRYAS